MKKQNCCPKFNPKPWDGKTHIWKNKKFIKGRVFTLFYMPVNFGGIITYLMNKIDSSKAKCVDNMALSDHTSAFNMDLFVAVNKKIPGAENVNISGKFLSKVYEGNYNETGKWLKDFEAYAKSKKLKTGKQYMWYTTCPKCAKKYGKNYTVIMGKFEK